MEKVRSSLLSGVSVVVLGESPNLQERKDQRWRRCTPAPIVATSLLYHDREDEGWGASTIGMCSVRPDAPKLLKLRQALSGAATDGSVTRRQAWPQEDECGNERPKRWVNLDGTVCAPRPHPGGGGSGRFKSPSMGVAGPFSPCVPEPVLARWTNVVLTDQAKNANPERGGRRLPARPSCQGVRR